VTTPTAVPFPDVDDLTVAFCIDGYIAFRKLTRREREAVVARCLARGWTHPQIVVRCHGTASMVATAIQELRAHEGVIAHDDVA
jgi:hypothetical protein